MNQWLAQIHPNEVEASQTEFAHKHLWCCSRNCKLAYIYKGILDANITFRWMSKKLNVHYNLQGKYPGVPCVWGWYLFILTYVYWPCRSKCPSFRLSAVMKNAYYTGLYEQLSAGYACIGLFYYMCHPSATEALSVRWTSLLFKSLCRSVCDSLGPIRGSLFVD